MTDKQLWWKTFFKYIAIILLTIILLIGAGFAIFVIASAAWGKWILITVVCTCPIIYYAKEKADEAQHNREYFRKKIEEDEEDIKEYRQKLEYISSLDLTPEEEKQEISFLTHQIRYHENELKRHLESLSHWIT